MAERTDLEVATRELSTAESVSGDVDAVVVSGERRPGFAALLLQGWRRLTTMRTALVLLFLLALAAIPGSLFPQRGVNTPRVRVYYEDHPRLAPVLDRLGLFDVFGSTWFYTLYALLAVSLVGCLVPRMRLHARSSVARPPAPPRHFDRLPSSTSFRTAAQPGDVAAAAHELLRSRRWRADRRTAADGAPAVAAEKGYLRETGNLVFHVSLLVLLAAVAVGALFGYTGVFAVTEGAGFTNTVAAYDSFTPGQRVDGGSISPFTVRLDDFRAAYAENNVPLSFHADVTWARGIGEPEKRRDIRVNHPLAVGGAKVYLLGSGFAPRFVVRDKHGRLVSDEYVRFLPQQNSNQYSTGVVKVANGLPYDVGIEAAFVPTLAFDPQGNPYSASPEATAPVVLYQVFTGDLRLTSAQSVYAFDKAGMTAGAAGVLLPGRTIALPGGATVTWDGLRDYAVFQTTRNPGTRTAFYACVLGLLGLVGSLFVRRRRIWVRATPSDGGTFVAVGGLARHDAERFRGEFAAFTAELGRRVAVGEPPSVGQPAAAGQHSEES